MGRKVRDHSRFCTGIIVPPIARRWLQLVGDAAVAEGEVGASRPQGKDEFRGADGLFVGVGHEDTEKPTEHDITAGDEMHGYGEKRAADAPILLLEDMRAHRLAAGRSPPRHRPQVVLQIRSRRFVDASEYFEEKPGDGGHIRFRHQPDGALARTAYTGRLL